MRKELRSIQVMRGIAACMVLGVHLSIRFADPWNSLNQGVDLFFCISGLVMYISTVRRDEGIAAAKRFMRRRFIRVVPLYWIFLTAYVIETRSYSLGEITRSYLFIRIHWPVLSVGWTLVFELFFYLCFAATIALRVSALTLIPAFVLMVMVGRCSLFDPRLLSFLAGILIAALIYKSKRLPTWVGVMIIPCYVGVLVWGRADIPPTSFYRYVMTPAAWLFVYSFCSIEMRGARFGNRFLLLLGDSSYALYLSHMLVLQAAEAMRRHNTWMLGPAASISLLAILCIAISIAVHKAIEVPLLHRLSRLFSDRRPLLAEDLPSS